MNFKFCGAASYKFNQAARHMAAPKQCIWRFAEILSQWRAWQTAEISPRQHIRQAARILQDHSLPHAAKISLLRHTQGAEIAKASAQNIKILLPRHTPQAKISRAENCENSAAMRQAASRRNFIEAARMTSHQIPAENHKIIAESCKILIERHKIPAERGAAR